MPFTPLHFGAGLLIKPFLNRYFSLSLFIFTQIIIDTEPLYFMLKGDWVIHRLFHTYLGVTIPALIAIIIGKPLCQWFLNFWNNQMDAQLKKWLYISEPTISWKSAIISAMIGAYSHVFLDSFMHADMHPFAPFSEANPLLHQVSLSHLHLFCFVSGFIGFVIFLVLRGYTLWRQNKS